MSEKIDKGLSVFTRRKQSPIEPPQAEVKVEARPVVAEQRVEPKVEEPKVAPVNHLEKKVILEPRKQLAQVEETKFSFYAPNSLFNDLEDHLNAIKRKTGWRLSKKDYFGAIMEAYVEVHQRIPDAKNYEELVGYFKKVLKE
jgi:hypothetical protein